MGAGLARQAAQRFPDLNLKYGAYCRELVLRASPEKIKIPLVAFYEQERSDTDEPHELRRARRCGQAELFSSLACANLRDKEGASMKTRAASWII